MAKSPAGSCSPRPRLTTMSLIMAALLLFTLGVELLEIGPKFAGFLFVLDAGEDHLGARDFGLRILDVFLESRLAPDDAGILVGVGVAIVGRGAGVAAVETIELGPDLVLRAFADGMAGKAFLEGLLAGRHVLRACRVARQRGRQRQNTPCYLHCLVPNKSRPRSPGRPARFRNGFASPMCQPSNGWYRSGSKVTAK